MTLIEAMGYIRQAKKIPSVEWVSFTGGEPFLFPDLLIELIEVASGFGLHTECVTNCFWARSLGNALKILSRFREAGLTTINISTDDFHQEHLPFDRVRNCFNAAKDLGIKIIIMSAVNKSSTITADHLGELLEDDNVHILQKGTSRSESTTALAVESGFLPIGSGTKIPETERVIENRPLKGACDVVLRDISIDPSGNVLPCCSAAGMAETAVIGHAKRSKLNGIIREAGRHPFFKVLSAEGPKGLCKYLRLNDTSKAYVNKCHLCYELLTGQDSGNWKTWNLSTNDCWCSTQPLPEGSV
jgi:MoaA/NifB/PqqE/SkfB family radical SAM enzyme